MQFLESNERAEAVSHPSARWSALVFAIVVAVVVAYAFARSNQYAWFLQAARHGADGPIYLYHKQFGYPLREPSWVSTYSAGGSWREEVLRPDGPPGWRTTVLVNWTYGLCSVFCSFEAARRLATRLIWRGARPRLVHLLLLMVLCGVALAALRRYPEASIVASLVSANTVGLFGVAWFTTMVVRAAWRRVILARPKSV